MFSDILSIRARTVVYEVGQKIFCFGQYCKNGRNIPAELFRLYFYVLKAACLSQKPGLSHRMRQYLCFKFLVFHWLHFLSRSAIISTGRPSPADRTAPPVAARFRLEKSECISLLLPKEYPAHLYCVAQPCRLG